MRRLRWSVLSCVLAATALAQGCGSGGATGGVADAGEAGSGESGAGGSSGNAGSAGKGGKSGSAGKGGSSGNGAVSGAGAGAAGGASGAAGDDHAAAGANDGGTGGHVSSAGAGGEPASGGASGHGAGDAGASGASNDGEAGASGAGGAPIEGEHCRNARDDDHDGLVDCADDDCSTSSACGASPVGSRCENDTDCAGGVCILEDPYGFPGGYCSTPCLPDVGACGAGGGLCVHFPVGPHAAVCWKACVFGEDTCDDALYSCQGVSSDEYACGPECTAHADCPVLGNCNFDRGFCDALLEDCSNGQDDDGEGYVDCNDLNCCDHPSCDETPNPSCR